MAQIGEIWKVVNPRLVEINGRFYYDTEVRPFLIIDDGRGLIVDANPDYLGTKLTTKSKTSNFKKQKLKDWKKAGLEKPTYVRIEIPERIEEAQLIEKLGEVTTDDLVDVYKVVLELFNIKTIEKLVSEEKEEVVV